MVSVSRRIYNAIEQSYTEQKVDYLLNSFYIRFRGRVTQKLIEKRIIEHLLSYRIVDVKILNRVEEIYKDYNLECKQFSKMPIKYNNVDLTRKLLDNYNVDVNSLNGYPIIKAISMKNDDLIELLLSHKPNLSLSNHKAVQYLILNGDIDRLKRLTEERTEKKGKKRKRSLPALELTSEMLYWCTKYKKWDLVNWMMEDKGVPPNIKTINLLS